MQMIIRQIIVAMLCALTFSVSNAHASTFGDSCTPLPRVDDSGYLLADTAYGYIKQSIDMKTYVTDGCTDESSEIKFCIKNQSGSAEPCQLVSLNMGEESSLGALSSNPDIGGNDVLKDVIIGTEIIDSKACITMPTSRGPMPLMCRYLTAPAEEILEAVCRNVDESCYETNTKTQSLLSFSGLTIHCLRNTLDKILYVGMECPAPEEENLLTTLRPFAGFQKAMTAAVRAALILYVMVYGFKMVMNNEYTHFDKIALFLVKFLFVMYFAVGLGEKVLDDGQAVSRNGVTELGLPIFAELTATFAEIVFFAGGAQGLCSFDADKYESGYTFYRLWDAIDCRVGYYFGMQILYNLGDVISSMVGSTDSEAGRAIDFSGNGNSNAYDALSKAGAFSYFIVMCGLFLNGSILAVIMGLVFAALLVSILMYFFTVYLVCLVTLYVMAYLAPIFVPMVLFDRTKSYFDSWLKVVVSCMLQPAVIAAFIAMLLTMYDSAIYGNCEFARHDYESNGFSFSTFELRLPDAEESECISSFGYKMLSYYTGVGWEGKDLILFTLYSLKDTLDLLSSLIYVVIYMVVFYFFIQSVNEFASDLTGGPNLENVTASPTSIVDKAMTTLSAWSKKPKDQGETTEKKGARAGPSTDKVSTEAGAGKARDKMSTGGGNE